MHKIFKLINEKIMFPMRFRYLTDILSPHLKGNNKVLDVGASCGRLAKSIQDNVGGEFVGADVHVQPKTHIPIIKYDGEKLPFENKSFDSVMIVDVLHHADNLQNVISEAKRVSRKNIVIKDHFWTSKFDFKVLKYVDYFGNKCYGVSLPYNFLSMKGWHDLIKANDLSIVDTKKFRYNMLDPCKHVVFKLQV